MLNDFYDVDSEPIVTLETFYGPKKHLVDKNDNPGRLDKAAGYCM